MEFKTIEEIYAGLDKSRAKLIYSVAELDEASANLKPAPEKWSTANIVAHLAKTEENLTVLVGKLLAKAEAENAPAKPAIEPPVSFAEMSEKVRGARLEAPDAIRPAGTETLADSLVRLEKSRATIKELRPRLEAVDLSNARFPHPYFGAMNLYYWLAFIGLHELHHLRQISEILAKRT
jgi:hypothetical protein